MCLRRQCIRILFICIFNSLLRKYSIFAYIGDNCLRDTLSSFFAERVVMAKLWRPQVSDPSIGSQRARFVRRRRIRLSPRHRRTLFAALFISVFILLAVCIQSSSWAKMRLENLILDRTYIWTVPPISAVVLFHNEYPTLNHTLGSWERNGLLNVVSEVVFFLNGVASRDEFDKQIPRLKDPQWKGLARVVVSPDNRPLGLAIREMVRLAKHEYVLLLEKDWALIEPENEVHAQLSLSTSLIQKGVAHVVRFRHRHRPGVPLHARIMHEGREQQMLQQQSNLYCYMHHWIDDLDQNYSKYFWQCKGSDKLSERVWCAKARYCQWTNNPGMFSRRWFLEKLGDPFERDYNNTVKKDPNSGMLDFEFYTNWNMPIWNNRGYVVALPRGLFEHQEVGEQEMMNTVWYAWNRLHTDATEKRQEYFETEIKECKKQKSHDSGITFMHKYPLEFVHLYHYNQAMKRSSDEAVRELEGEARRVRDRLEEGHGTWRNGVTDLTNFWYKRVLYTYPTEPKYMNVAFVIAVYAVEGTAVDLSRLNVVSENLNHLRGNPILVYTDVETSERLQKIMVDKHGWTIEEASRVHFVTKVANALLSDVLTESVVSHIESVRGQSDWKARVVGRSGGSVPSFTEVGLALAKPLLLRDAERRTAGRNNSEDDIAELRGLTHFVWVDAWSNCVRRAKSALSSSNLDRRNDHVLRGHMLLNCLVSGRHVTSDSDLEIMLGSTSGFDAKVLLQEAETTRLSAGLRVVDGRIIGGSRLAIILMAGYYDVVLRDMLRNGQLGSEREPLTIAHKNVDYNFQFVDAWSACPNHGCPQPQPLAKGSAAVTSDSGCRLFEWAGKCALGGKR